MAVQKRPALGRGLSALIPTMPPTALSQETPKEVDLDLLHPNRDQPRGDLDNVRLEELAVSIRANGVIQPILVSRNSDGTFEIIAGERRWRAAQRAGLLRVPVVVREVSADKRLELALIENVQREDLNPMEVATAYKRLADDFQMTQEEIARSVGKERATVANYVRLLTLPVEVRAEVAAGALTMGHARALAGVADAGAQRHAAHEIRARDLSVRETEALVKTLTAPQSRPASADAGRDVHTKAAEEHLRRVLGTGVRIVRRGKRGRLEIAFTSDAELQRLYEQLTNS